MSASGARRRPSPDRPRLTAGRALNRRRGPQGKPGAEPTPRAARVAGSVLVRREVGLASAAHRTEPGVGDVLELGAGRDPAIGVALFGVVDEPARLAHLFNGRGSLAITYALGSGREQRRPGARVPDEHR